MHSWKGSLSLHQESPLHPYMNMKKVWVKIPDILVSSYFLQTG